MGWILAVLEESIAKSVLSYRTAREIWSELNERYGQSSNAQLYSFQEKVNNSVQTPSMTIAEFFTKIKNILDEFDSLHPLPICSCTVGTSCSCDITNKCYKMQQIKGSLASLLDLTRNTVKFIPICT